MTHRRPKLVALVAAAALLLTAASCLPAPVGADRTPPSTPLFGYAQGFFCFTLYIGVGRVSDNVTPEPQLRYEAYANGEFIGSIKRFSENLASRGFEPYRDRHARGFRGLGLRQGGSGRTEMEF